MDRTEFVERIVQRHKMSEDEKRTLKQDYFMVLSNDIDFDKLFQTYIEEYANKTYPPPAWFKQRAKKKIINSTSAPEIRDLLVVLPNGNQYQFAYEHPLETEQQAIEAIKERFQNRNYKLYRIVKEYDFEKDCYGVENGWLRYKEQIYI